MRTSRTDRHSPERMGVGHIVSAMDFRKNVSDGSWKSLPTKNIGLVGERRLSRHISPQ